MRIGRRVTVSGKMFGRGDHPAALRALDERGDQFGHFGGIFAIGTHVDDRIGGVVVYVGDRRVNLLNAERACFARSQFALPSRVIRITRRSHSHVPGEVNRIVKAHARAGFEI